MARIGDTPATQTGRAFVKPEDVDAYLESIYQPMGGGYVSPQDTTGNRLTPTTIGGGGLTGKASVGSLYSSVVGGGGTAITDATPSYNYAQISPPPPPREQWPEGFYPAWDSSVLSYVWRVVSPEGLSDTEITKYQQGQLDLAAKQFEQDKLDQERQFLLEQQAQENARLAQEAQLRLSQSQQAAYERTQQQQLAQTEKQRLAQMATQPVSWLQYHQEQGTQPVIQPWMIPLGQEFQGLGAGAPLPGWQGLSTQENSLSQLSPLLNPSAQYWARMGPTAQQQFLGYRQARTGALPEETQTRLRASAPPSGQFPQLRRTR